MYKVFRNHQEVYVDEDLDICVSYAHSVYEYGDTIKIMNDSNRVVHVIGIESKINEDITIEEYIKTIHEWKKSLLTKDNNKQ